MSNSLFGLCQHIYVLSISSKLEHDGWGHGERNKQQGGSGYEAGTYFMALYVTIFSVLMYILVCLYVFV